MPAARHESSTNFEIWHRFLLPARTFSMSSCYDGSYKFQFQHTRVLKQILLSDSFTRLRMVICVAIDKTFVSNQRQSVEFHADAEEEQERRVCLTGCLRNLVFI